MKKNKHTYGISLFLRRVLIFTGIIAAYLLVNILINVFISRQQAPGIQARNLIIGDSHVQRSIDPKYLHNTRNIAQPAEPYSLTYYKLKKILQHHSPDTVFIGFSPHNISGFNDKKLTDTLWSFEMFRRAYPLIGHLMFQPEVEMDRTACLAAIIRHMGLYPKKGHGDYIGFYRNQYAKKMNTDHEYAIYRHFFYRGKNAGVSEYSVKLLRKMVSLARQKKVTPILVATPVHPTYLKNIPDNFRQKFNTLKTEMKAKGVCVMDYRALELHDTLYLNSDHVDTEGTEVFSKMLRNDLERLQTCISTGSQQVIELEAGN